MAEWTDNNHLGFDTREKPCRFLNFLPEGCVFAMRTRARYSHWTSVIFNGKYEYFKHNIIPKMVGKRIFQKNVFSNFVKFLFTPAVCPVYTVRMEKRMTFRFGINVKYLYLGTKKKNKFIPIIIIVCKNFSLVLGTRHRIVWWKSLFESVTRHNIILDNITKKKGCIKCLLCCTW